MAANKNALGKLQRLDPYPVLEEVPLVFSVRCIHTQKNYRYDLTSFHYQYENITRAFAWSMLSKRSSVGHDSREGAIAGMRTLYTYFDAIDNSTRLSCPADIDTRLLREYAEWLRGLTLSYSTKASRFRALSPLIKRWVGKPWAAKDLLFPPSMFPHSHRTTKTFDAFTDEDLQRIVSAVKSDLRTSKLGLEKAYQPQYLGKAAPLDDVAPFNESLPPQYQHDIWKSEDYKIWWWENFCSYQPLKPRDIAAVKQGTTFLRSLSSTWNRTSAGGIGTSARLQKFYADIGAGPEYVPRFFGQPCPIKYDNRWKKYEYLQWYWENHCNCTCVPYGQMRKLYPRFVNAIREHHGSLIAFFDFVGIKHRIDTSDLMPYYVALLVTTAFNPSTIRKLKTDCVVEDKFDGNSLSVDWTKLRSFTNDLTIPSPKTHGLSPGSILLRLFEATRHIRGTNPYIFVTNEANSGSRQNYELSKAMLQKALRRWAYKHGLSDIGITAKIFRSTTLRNEYKRTGNLDYVQTLAGHSRPEMTSEYVKKVGDSVLRFTRGIHLQAMFVCITESRESGIALLKQEGVSKAQIRAMNQPGDKRETAVAHCKDPLNSPVEGERKGAQCLSQNYCLYCSNLVVTEYDLVRHFSKVNYHQNLLDDGMLTGDEFELAVGEAIHIFDQYICPRFSEEVVERSRALAISSPPLEWKILRLVPN